MAPELGEAPGRTPGEAPAHGEAGTPGGAPGDSPFLIDGDSRQKKCKYYSPKLYYRITLTGESSAKLRVESIGTRQCYCFGGVMLLVVLIRNFANT